MNWHQIFSWTALPHKNPPSLSGEALLHIPLHLWRSEESYKIPWCSSKSTDAQSVEEVSLPIPCGFGGLILEWGFVFILSGFFFTLVCWICFYLLTLTIICDLDIFYLIVVINHYERSITGQKTGIKYFNKIYFSFLEQCSCSAHTIIL